MSTELNLGIHTGSIHRGLDESGSEFRRLYEAIDAAARYGEPVTITRYGKTLRLVPAEEACDPCQEGRHEDCLVVWTTGGAEGCSCDRRTVHDTIDNQRAYAYRLARRPT